MAEQPVKISFGFSKLAKKPAIVLPVQIEKKSDIQFVESLENNSIKLVDGEEKAKEALVIPLKNANALRDNMVEALKARREEKLAKIAEKKLESKIDNSDDKKNGAAEAKEDKPLTLDEMAAKEILEDLKKSNEMENEPSVREIPASNVTSLGEKESTLEDYENIPVQEFGLAVLRGMGWTPDQGIGKNGQIVKPVNPVVRPKGMGLGADKVARPITLSKNKEELVLKKSALLKVVSGPHKNLYGKVEGFDELPGRLLVRLTIQNNVISISENIIQLVTSEEYNKNSKILNLNEYENFSVKENLKNSNKMKHSPSPSRVIKKEKISNYDGRVERNKNLGGKTREPSSEPEIRKPRKERRRSPSSSADEKSSRKAKNRSTYSSESEEEYRKSSKSRKSPIRNRETESKKSSKKKNRRDSLSSSDEIHYERDRKDKRRDPSSGSDSEEKPRYKSKKGRRSLSPLESEDERRRRKMRGRDRDMRRPRENSPITVSSSDEEPRKGKQKDKERKKKKKSRHSDSPPERHSKHKKHKDRARNRSRSKSPTIKKKKKSRRRSSS